MTKRDFVHSVSSLSIVSSLLCYILSVNQWIKDFFGFWFQNYRLSIKLIIIFDFVFTDFANRNCIDSVKTQNKIKVSIAVEFKSWLFDAKYARCWQPVLCVNVKQADFWFIRSKNGEWSIGLVKIGKNPAKEKLTLQKGQIIGRSWLKNLFWSKDQFIVSSEYVNSNVIFTVNYWHVPVQFF